MKAKLIALMLVAGGAAFAQTRVSIGVQFGDPGYYRPVPPPPVVVHDYRPPCPGPGYVWIGGYYDGYGDWYDGYWTVPPYTGAYWVAPRRLDGRFIAGYWGSPRGYYRNDYRRDYRDHEWRERARREREDHEGDDDHDHGRGHYGRRGGDFGWRYRR
jgi:hypothetical protein